MLKHHRGSGVRVSVWVVVSLSIVLFMTLAPGCSPSATETTPPRIAADEHDPAVWGEFYPEEYQRWLMTRDERPAGKSAFKRGFDGGVMFDKLSQYPFMAVLFNGWGFGIDYNEPRGHYYMLIDQKEADPSRVKAGGACLTCKSSYTQDLYEKDSQALFAATYDEAVDMLPEEHRELGATCIDCHDNESLDVRTRRWTLDAGLEEIGVDKQSLTGVQERTLACGQCHCTYSVMKDGTKSVDVDFPWEGGKWGAITVESIIKSIEEQAPRHEWVQSTTGFKLGYIRHPDMEFFTAGSPHAAAGLSCPDCHMPEIALIGKTVRDHNLMSPLKQASMPCACHAGKTDQELRDKVIEVQKQTASGLINAGYQTATVAKLFETANASLESTVGDPAYDEAARHYREAFYRVVYMGAENSVGFHNPAEGARILADARTEAAKADAILRKLLASKNVKVPAEVDMELLVYLTDRGVKKLDYKPEQHIPDPSGRAQKTWPANLSVLK